MEEAIYFTDAEEFRGWLEYNHRMAEYLWVGFSKKGKGKKQVFGYQEAVAVSLCYGWIDGRTQSVDQLHYRVRFTPRKQNSVWSNKNCQLAEELIATGLMHQSGLDAYNRRPDKSSPYSYESRPAQLSEEMEALLMENSKAYYYFMNASASYRKTCIAWIMSAKTGLTQLKRLNTLINSSNKGKRIPMLGGKKDFTL